MTMLSHWGDIILFGHAKFADKFVIAYLVISLLSSFGFLYAILSRGKNAFHYLFHSAVLYLLAYSLKIINIFLHEELHHVKIGYIFTYVFSDGWEQAADLLVLLIICSVTYYQIQHWGAHTSFYLAWRFLCLASLIALAALALYRWAVSTCSIVLYLNAAPHHTSAELTHTATLLRVGYQIVYLVVSTSIAILVVYYILRRTRFQESLNIVEILLLMVTLLLLVRSAALVYIDIKYALKKTSRPNYLDTVTESLYGPPTVVIYLLLNKLSNVPSTSTATSDVLREGRRMAGKDLKRRRMEALDGGPPLPTPVQLLAELESKPLLYIPDSMRYQISTLTVADLHMVMARHIEDVLNLREKT